MAVFVDPKTGEKFENDAPDAEARAQEFGLVTQAAYDAEQRSGGLGSRILTAGEEAVRQVASGGAALARGIESAAASPEAVAQLEAEAGSPVAPEAVGAPTDVQGRDIAPGVYTPEAIERRAVNPASAALGAAAPSLAASIALPG